MRQILSLPTYQLQHGILQENFFASDKHRNATVMSVISVLINGRRLQESLLGIAALSGDF